MSYPGYGSSIFKILIYMDMNTEEMQKLKRENYPEYRKIYRNQKLKSIQCYCDVCKNGKKNIYLKGKMVTFRD